MKVFNHMNANDNTDAPQTYCKRIVIVGKNAIQVMKVRSVWVILYKLL